MKKITCLFAALLAFIGVANAQETKDPYTLAQGAEVQLSTDDAFYAYYVRDASNSNKFLKPTDVTAAQTLATFTTSSSDALMVALYSETGSTNPAVYVVDEAGNKLYKWRSGGANKLWLIIPEQVASVGAAGFYTIVTKTSGDEVDVKYSLSGASNRCFFASGDNVSNKIGNTTSDVWQFIPANVPAKQAAGWPKVNILQGDDVHGNLTTFSSSKAVILPSTDEVYTASLSADNSTLELTNINSSITLDGNLALPSGKGVVIKGQVGSTYAIPFTDSRDLAVVTDLKGTNETAVTVTDDTHYALGMPDAELGFYKVKSGTSIGANKAYLNIPTGSAAIKMVFADNNTTGIHTAASAAVNTNAPIYDLSGRRVANAVKGGVYIQNGKKFVK